MPATDRDFQIMRFWSTTDDEQARDELQPQVDRILKKYEKDMEDNNE